MIHVAESRLKQIQYIGITDDDLALLHHYQGLFQSIVHALSKMFNLDSQLVLEAYQEKEKEQINELADDQTQVLTVVSRIAQNLTGMIAELRENTDNIAESACNTASSQEHTEELVQHLSDEIKHIEQMSGTIRELSDQTHLLGLNAAIEAAHAQEAGRGFQIVAQEVRKLASNSKQAQEQIQRKVLDIPVCLTVYNPKQLPQQPVPGNRLPAQKNWLRSQS